jgi:gliding motility-associated-like protein
LKRKYNIFVICLFYFCWSTSFSQDVSLYQQFNGRFDFTFIGNTLNPQENTFQVNPDILSSSAANLNLSTSDTIQKAYLYWAGSGTGDFEVQLNTTNIIAERTFAHQRIINGVLFDYFSAFTEVTEQIIDTGNGSYTFSGLDIAAALPLHFTRRTNFAGWGIIIIYKNDALPLNQVNIYDGLQGVPDELTITLSSLNVIDEIGAKIGFLAWEGDVGIAVNETLTINGAILSNPPLNPANNAFNGTNSFTGSTVLYNMDLDVYDIQNNIETGDVSAEISLTSGQDFVMINAIVTKLNSQVPDAVIAIDDFTLTCDSKIIPVEYTVANLATATNPLPAETPISIYANEVLIASTSTQNIIEIGESETGTIILTIPDAIVSPFQLLFVVDDIGDGTGIVSEINELNNSFLETIVLYFSPEFNTLPNLESCNEGFGVGTFDFSAYENLVKVNSDDEVRFFETLEDAAQNTNAIGNTFNYTTTATPKEIYIRLENDNCFSITSFLLVVKNCPPTIYNFISANNDGFNDSFVIDGIKNVFINYELTIYNRWGVLIWRGNNNLDFWKGEVNVRNTAFGNEVPDGTYYYVLQLNDPDYPNPFVGYLYFTK